MEFGADQRCVRKARPDVADSVIFAEVTDSVFTVKLARDHAEVTYRARTLIRRVGDPDVYCHDLDSMLRALVPLQWLSYAEKATTWKFLHMFGLGTNAVAAGAVPGLSLLSIRGALAEWFEIYGAQLDDLVVPEVVNDFPDMPELVGRDECDQKCRKVYRGETGDDAVAHGVAEGLKVDVLSDRIAYEFDGVAVEIRCDSKDKWEWEVLRVVMSLFPAKWVESLVPDIRDFQKARGVYDRGRYLDGLYPAWWGGVRCRLKALHSLRFPVESVVCRDEELVGVGFSDASEVLGGFDLRQDFDPGRLSEKVSGLSSVVIAGLEKDIDVGGKCYLDLLLPDVAEGYVRKIESSGGELPVAMTDAICRVFLTYPVHYFRAKVWVSVSGQSVHVSCGSGEFVMHGFAFVRALLLFDAERLGIGDFREIFRAIADAESSDVDVSFGAKLYLANRIRGAFSLYDVRITGNEDVLLRKYFEGTVGRGSLAFFSEIAVSKL